MPLKVTVLDVNDNSPEIVDPQGDVVSVREEQPPGTEVARVRALDTDLGENASVTYTILKGNAILAVLATLNLQKRDTRESNLFPRFAFDTRGFGKQVRRFGKLINRLPKQLCTVFKRAAKRPSSVL